ncbi:MAG: 4-(cytidine 5'-diphospho)-2-C-methyl-D-erythritol kinase [Bacteroidetes bacterium]|nr:4-(cytidine 5'-diphospho)-2-C-methyl-D-erythritol kinase [Bacteroidota bacterium]
MTVRSYAKINLGLRILARRGDGFHDLVTIFHRVDLFDTLHFEVTAGGISLESDHEDIPTDDGNLCVRAARLLLAQQRGMGVHITLHKRVPAGAGLGGGSANAATVLRFLPSLFGFHLPQEEVLEMATILGSDVPFFLQDGSAVARSRGEQLEYFSWRCPWWIVLVHPGVHVSTAWAYANLRLSEAAGDVDLRQALLSASAAVSGSPPSLSSFEDGGTLTDADSSANPSAQKAASAFSELMHNDFEPLVMQAHPEIQAIKKRLLNAGAVGALMSGSGSAVYGLFSSQKQAMDCAATFPADQLLSVTEPDFSPEYLPWDS